MKVSNSIEDLVGGTPLLRLHAIERELGFDGPILAKLEFFNPTSSVKDRIARSMIAAAEQAGTLRPGGTIIEATSGNTGIAEAAIAAAKGYRAIFTMPAGLSEERARVLKAFGAEVVFTPAEENMGGANARAAKIHEETPGSVVLGQGGNPANPQAHFETTGPEIWRDTEGGVDVFVASVGTGGTLSGVGKYLKGKKPGVKVVGVEPAGSAVLNGGTPGPHKIQGIGGGAVAPVTDVSLIDEVIDVSDDDAYRYARALAHKEGVFAGISAGAALRAVVELAGREESRGKTIVLVVPDSGDRYLSTDLFD